MGVINIKNAKVEKGEGKMDFKKLFALGFIVALVLTITPVYAWTYPDCTEDERYEAFGPRLDRLHIILYPSEADEWETGLELGKIDMTDWPLDKSHYDKYTTAPWNETIKTVYYGPELGYFVIDINNDNSPEKAPGHPNPVYKKNPCGFVQIGTEPYKETAREFRKALWRTMNRDYVIANIWLGMAEPMYTVMTAAQGVYLHPNASVPVEEGGLNWLFSLEDAKAILDAAGFVDTDGNGWRNFPVDLGGDGSDIVLIYYGRSDHKLRNDLAIAHADWIKAIGVNVDLRLADRRACFREVMLAKNFMLYTGGWSIGRDPDSPPVLYYSGYYWHPGFCYNYGRVNCTEFDRAVESLLEANTFEELVYWAWKCQEEFNWRCFGAIPVCSSAGYKAYYRRYTGGTAGVPVSPDDGENQYLSLIHI